VFAEIGRLPRRGDTISSGDFSIRVESVHHNRVEAVRIRQRRPAHAESESDPGGRHETARRDSP
jgi:CBS domain containing-hemolysin-like protein